MSKSALIASIEEQHLKNDITEFNVGDTIRVSLRIVEEGGKERIQMFTGTCIGRNGGGLSETVSVHRVAYGEGMERVFFLHSPHVVKIEVIRKGQVRRAKLFYLRGTSGKASKVKARYVSTKKDNGQEAAMEESEAAV